MRTLFLILLLILPGAIFGDGPKKLTITGATWASPSGEKNNPVKTHIIETDDQGRVTKVYDVKSPKSAMVIAYSDHRVDFALGGGAKVKIDGAMAWTPGAGAETSIEYSQQNDIPESIVAGKKYPRSVAKKAFTIVLSQPTSAEYSWKEVRGESWLEEDGRSRYRCVVGKQVVWEQFDPSGALKYQTILDGHTSDASPETTGKMLYTKTKGSVIGKYYWTFEPMAWDEAAWDKGGRIEYSGDSLTTGDPVVNVANYYLLQAWFYTNAWNYFGPTLFGIPIR